MCCYVCGGRGGVKWGQRDVVVVMDMPGASRGWGWGGMWADFCQCCRKSLLELQGAPKRFDMDGYSQAP